MKKKKRSDFAGKRKSAVSYRLYDGKRLVCGDSWPAIHRAWAKMDKEGKTPRLSFVTSGTWILICR